MDKDVNTNVANEEYEKIMIKGEDGTERLADVLLYFTLKENGKDYIIYTFHYNNSCILLKLCSSSILGYLNTIE